jgi:hypothetical protein
MRRKSGNDEGRNQFLDPTAKERERELGKTGTAVLDTDSNRGEIEDNFGQRTTGMGSNTRKGRQDGERD